MGEFLKTITYTWKRPSLSAAYCPLDTGLTTKINFMDCLIKQGGNRMLSDHISPPTPA